MHAVEDFVGVDVPVKEASEGADRHYRNDLAMQYEAVVAHAAGEGEAGDEEHGGVGHLHVDHAEQRAALSHERHAC